LRKESNCLPAGSDWYPEPHKCREPQKLADLKGPNTAKIEREVIVRVFTSVPDLARKLRRYINA
jgi:hypothetical protein